MKFKPLWSVHIETSPAVAPAFAEALGDEPLALTVLSPPRKPTARIEALYAEKPDRAALTASLGVAAALLKTKIPALKIQEVPDLDWLHKVAADFPPLPVARWTVYGAQHKAAVPDRRRGLQVDATSAFGTGEHPTTKGCLLMLNRMLKAGMKGRRMLDMGCGSGILAMAWAKARPGRALGIDNDLASVDIARHNAAANGLRGRVRAVHGYGYAHASVPRNGPYDLIMANIFAKPLTVMAKDLRRNLRPGGIAILSGLLTHQANRVLGAHRLQKLYAVQRLRLGEWAVLVLKRRI